MPWNASGRPSSDVYMTSDDTTYKLIDLQVLQITLPEVHV